jgi:hypothetical protein
MTPGLIVIKAVVNEHPLGETIGAGSDIEGINRLIFKFGSSLYFNLRNRRGQGT